MEPKPDADEDALQKRSAPMGTRAVDQEVRVSVESSNEDTKSKIPSASNNSEDAGVSTGRPQQGVETTITANSYREVARHFGVARKRVTQWKTGGAPGLECFPYRIDALAKWLEDHPQQLTDFAPASDDRANLKNEELPSASTLPRSKSPATNVLLAAGIAIFTANIGFAWYVELKTNHFITQSLVGTEADQTATGRAMTMAEHADPNTVILLHRVVEADVHHRAIANRQATATVAMAAAFGLFAIGFALFVMGIESAFQLQGAAKEIGSVVLKASSPGLLCFVIATIIVVVAVLSRHEIQFSGFTVYPAGETRLDRVDDAGSQTDTGLLEKVKKLREEVGVGNSKDSRDLKNQTTKDESKQ